MRWRTVRQNRLFNWLQRSSMTTSHSTHCCYERSLRLPITLTRLSKSRLQRHWRHYLLLVQFGVYPVRLFGSKFCQKTRHENPDKDDFHHPRPPITSVFRRSVRQPTETITEQYEYRDQITFCRKTDNYVPSNCLSTSSLFPEVRRETTNDINISQNGNNYDT